MEIKSKIICDTCKKELYFEDGYFKHTITEFTYSDKKKTKGLMLIKNVSRKDFCNDKCFFISVMYKFLKGF